MMLMCAIKLDEVNRLENAMPAPARILLFLAPAYYRCVFTFAVPSGGGKSTTAAIYSLGRAVVVDKDTRRSDRTSAVVRMDGKLIWTALLLASQANAICP